MRATMLLICVLGRVDALLVQKSGAIRPSAAFRDATKNVKLAALPVALSSAVAAFASASSAMAATGGVDLGTFQSIALELPAAATDLGVPPEAGLALVGLVVVGGGGYYLNEQAAEKAQQEADAAERRRAAEFQAMKANDNNAGIFAMGIPAVISVGYFVWLVTNFS